MSRSSLSLCDSNDSWMFSLSKTVQSSRVLASKILLCLVYIWVNFSLHSHHCALLHSNSICLFNEKYIDKLITCRDICRFKSQGYGCFTKTKCYMSNYMCVFSLNLEKKTHWNFLLFFFTINCKVFFSPWKSENSSEKLGHKKLSFPKDFWICEELSSNTAGFYKSPLGHLTDF